MSRKGFVLGCPLVVVAGESVYFARRCAADIRRLLGERAFFANNHWAAWRHYEAALALGADRELEAAFHVGLPFKPSRAIRIAQLLIAQRLRDAPYRSHRWLLASDTDVALARWVRRSVAIDLSALTEDPLSNLHPEEWLGIAALEWAARLEPHDYIFHDLLVESFLEVGGPERAAVHCRTAVEVFPDLDAHSFLNRAGLPAAVVEAAIQGVEAARVRSGLIPTAPIDCAVGRLLAGPGLPERVLVFFERSLQAAPDLCAALAEIGVVHYRPKTYRQALEDLKRAVGLLPWRAWPHYHMGLADLAFEDRKSDAAQCTTFGRGIS
ncbi:MAG: hypothetical protein HY613_09185 [Candidatus Rokubacteria bacterium]|nr:hypothetical protein [Candidatus Rokubacteria bacterium]